jgi:hypothetical protein
LFRNITSGAIVDNPSEQIGALMMIEVIGIRRLGGFMLELEFSDGTVGGRDFWVDPAEIGANGRAFERPDLHRTSLRRRRRSHVAEWIRLGPDRVAFPR